MMTKIIICVFVTLFIVTGLYQIRGIFPRTASFKATPNSEEPFPVACRNSRGCLNSDNSNIHTHYVRRRRRLRRRRYSLYRGSKNSSVRRQQSRGTHLDYTALPPIPETSQHLHTVWPGPRRGIRSRCFAFTAVSRQHCSFVRHNKKGPFLSPEQCAGFMAIRTLDLCIV